MASAQNTNSDRLVIFRGDDTGGTFGRRLAFTIEAGDGVDLSGCRAEWIFDGIVKTFDAPLIHGEVREVFYSHNETEQMLLGVRYGTFRIIDSAGKRATMTNTRAVEVTDNVARCYPGASAATVRIGTFISWENISGKPILVKTVNGEAPDASGNINIEIEEPVLDDTVTAESPNGVRSSGIWSWVKSLLPHWLTSDYAEPATVASVANKRDKVDLAVYSVTRTENTDWTWTSENKELEAALNNGVKLEYNETSRTWVPQHDPDGYWSEPKLGSKEELSVSIVVHDNDTDEQYTATATRPRYMDETLGQKKPNQQLAAIATDDAAKPADGSLMKYDSANDRFVKAVEGTDYLKTHQDISGKLDKSGGTITGNLIGPAVGGSGFGWLFNAHGESLNDILMTLPTYADLSDKADRATTLSGYGITDGATKESIAPEYSATSAYSVGAIVYHDGNIYQCKTAIADGGESWNPAHWELRKLDDFFTESNSLLNGRLAYSRNTTGLKDRAFNALTFDGTEYNLSTALAAVTPTVENQPRDLLIVATATASTTISFTAGTIKGDKPTIDGAGTWLITLTEYAANTWYCRQIKMEDAA